MPITFGSVGDIISLSLLIKDLVKCLDGARGSSAEYQAVVRELWSLDHALLEVEILFRSLNQSVQLNALKATANRCAAECRKCIVAFQEQTKKYQKSLRQSGSENFFRDAASKVHWQLSEKEKLAKFRAEINAHCISINMLLVTTGVKLTILNDESISKRSKQSDEAYAKSSTKTSSLLQDVKDRLDENSSMIQLAAMEAKGLSSKVDESLQSFNANNMASIQKILKMNFMTFKAVASLQNQMPAYLAKCWTQEPASLEDALGRVTPVHLEFIDTWESKAFHAVLEVRFRQLPGHRKIQQKQYALRSSTLNKDIEQSIAFSNSFLPGQHVDMSMIFDGGAEGVTSCPGCKLAIDKTEEELKLETKCPGCGMWYQRIVQTQETTSVPSREVPDQLESPEIARPAKKRRREEAANHDEPGQFRRVRLRYWKFGQPRSSPYALWTCDQCDVATLWRSELGNQGFPRPCSYCHQSRTPSYYAPKPMRLKPSSAHWNKGMNQHQKSRLPRQDDFRQSPQGFYRPSDLRGEPANRVWPGKQFDTTSRSFTPPDGAGTFGGFKWDPDRIFERWTFGQSMDSMDTSSDEKRGPPPWSESASLPTALDVANENYSPFGNPAEYGISQTPSGRYDFSAVHAKTGSMLSQERWLHHTNPVQIWPNNLGWDQNENNLRDQAVQKKTKTSTQYELQDRSSDVMGPQQIDESRVMMQHQPKAQHEDLSNLNNSIPSYSSRPSKVPSSKSDLSPSPLKPPRLHHDLAIGINPSFPSRSVSYQRNAFDGEMRQHRDSNLPVECGISTAHLQTGSADFNRRLSAYFTNHPAMRTALDQAIDNSYTRQYPNTPQSMHNQDIYPSPFVAQDNTQETSPRSSGQL